jgi:hypothetical protein
MGLIGRGRVLTRGRLRSRWRWPSCVEHRLTQSRSPTTTGRVERIHPGVAHRAPHRPGLLLAGRPRRAGRMGGGRRDVRALATSRPGPGRSRQRRRRLGHRPSPAVLARRHRAAHPGPQDTRRTDPKEACLGPRRTEHTEEECHHSTGVDLSPITRRSAQQPRYVADEAMPPIRVHGSRARPGRPGRGSGAPERIGRAWVTGGSELAGQDSGRTPATVIAEEDPARGRVEDAAAGPS